MFLALCTNLFAFFKKYLLASSGVLFSQLLTEHKNLASVVVVTAAAGALQTEARFCSHPPALKEGHGKTTEVP